MILVSTDKLKTGQILAEEVRDINGRLLLSKGHTIAANHIRILKIWGISEVFLEGGVSQDDKPDLQLDPMAIEQTQKRLKMIFSHTDMEDPAIKKIFEIALRFRCEHNIPVENHDWQVNGKQIPRDDRPKSFQKKLKLTNIILPEIPSVALELQEVIADPMSSAEHIARVVSKSPSLTAVLLKIVNSSFYSLPSRISTVSHAVSLLGTKEISVLALGICVLSVFKNIPAKTINTHSFLKHSLLCGLLSRVFAAHKNLPQTEQLFVAGLLHDLGRLILLSYFPDESLQILVHARNRRKLLYEEEKFCLGCDHAQLGRQLMKQWRLPLDLENSVLYHHKPSEAAQSGPASIVHLSDIIANSLGIGTSGEKFVSPLDNAAWEDLKLSPNSFGTIIGQAIHQYQALESILQS
jgi:HD-like signal output (HDOD) protein